MSGTEYKEKRYEVFTNIYRVTLYIPAIVGQETVATRIAPPIGICQEACSDHSFTGYLRNLPLMPKGSKVMLYNGKEKSNQSAAYAVIEYGNR